MADPNTDLPDWASDAPPASGASPAPDDNSLPDWAKTPLAEPSAAHRAPAHHAASAPPAAQPHAAPQHAAANAPSSPELSWGQVGQQAVSNLGPSALSNAGALWQAVRHPIQTGENVLKVGQGMASQAAGALGVQQDPQQKAKTEALAKALEDHYTQTYGSVKGFKQAVATDPVSVATDAATVLGGGEAALGKVAGLEKAAAIAGKAAKVIDPMTYAVGAAKAAAKPATWVARKASAVGTGVPSSLLDVAAAAGKTSDPVLRGAFTKFYSGQGDPAEFLTTAQKAVGQMRKDASAEYLAKKATLANAQPSFQPVDDAIAKARQETMAGGIDLGQFPEANRALDEAQNLVNGWKTAQDPYYQGLEGFDNLKKAVRDIRDRTSNSVAQQHLDSIYNGVKQSIVDVDPKYADQMEQYQLGRNAITNMEKTLIGGGSKPAATAAMAKSLRALKTTSGKNLFFDLAQYEPTLPYMMAGQTLSPWAASGKAGVLEGLGIPMAGLTALHNPVAGMAQLAGQAALQSPKIAGALSFGTGLADRFANPLVKTGYYAGRVGQEGAQDAQISTAPPNVPTIEPQIPVTSSNNPLNLTALPNGQQWPGQIGMHGRFVSFATPEAGWQAADQNLKAYGEKHRIDTVSDVITRWAPPSENDTRSYIEGVSRALGIGPNDLIDLSDPMVRQRLLRAMQPFETGHHASGGRVGRASGGRITKDHEHLVQRLMNRAKSCRKEVNKTTEPLLNVSDHAIGHALAIANKAI